MSGVKHTPSWRWERLGCRVYEAGLYRGRSIRVAELSVARLDEDELNFRGRLIAAAPDLLEALKQAREVLHQHYVDWDGEPEDAVPLQLARAKCDAAIARATGDRPEKGGAL